ncbi:MAG: hypothetical protein ACRDWD_05770 [Acidimicrobiia bacterium]
MTDFTFFSGLAGFFFVLPIGFLVLAVLVLAGGRGEVDDTGRRTYALYIAVVSFIALFTALVGVTGVVNAVMDKVVDETESEDIVLDDDQGSDLDLEIETGGGGDENDQIARDAVQAGLVGAVALAVLAFHLRRRRDLVAPADFTGSAAWRVDRAYLYAVCFTAVLIFLFASAVALYAVFRVIAPDVTGSGDGDLERQLGIQQLVTLGFLSTFAGVIFLWSWRRAEASTL